MRQKSKLFLINGAILTSTSLLMKFAALIFNIYISNQIGSEAVGVFSLVMAVYLFFITVATSGLLDVRVIVLSIPSVLLLTLNSNCCPGCKSADV